MLAQELSEPDPVIDEEERQTALAVLEGLILKHQAKQSQLRSGGASAAPAKPKKTASVRR